MNGPKIEGRIFFKNRQIKKTRHLQFGPSVNKWMSRWEKKLSIFRQKTDSDTVRLASNYKVLLCNLNCLF